MSGALVERAVGILEANDRGGFTIPSPRLYPFQWNWDSAFSALGIATYDRRRAWTELETLFEAQWPCGMVPHIVFRRDDPDYFPGPSVWGTPHRIPTSGLSQPPVAASAALALARAGTPEDLERAAGLFDGMLASHDWFLTERDPDGTGLVAVVHPWESGRDNSPDWDAGMGRVVVAPDLEPYRRRDTTHVAGAQRPTAEQYDRFLTIVKFGREAGWDHRRIHREGPFLAADPGIQFILLRACRDLYALAGLLGRTEARPAIASGIERLEAGARRLWNDAVGGFCARDLRSGEFSPAVTNASMLCFHAGVGDAAQTRSMLAHARRILEKCAFGFPSWDPEHPRFESARYWRGPCWSVMNYMIANGLRAIGELELAGRIASDTLALAGRSGFRECFDPMDGAGLGGDAFSWTAAVHLALTDSAGGGRPMRPGMER